MPFRQRQVLDDASSWKNGHDRRHRANDKNGVPSLLKVSADRGLAWASTAGPRLTWMVRPSFETAVSARPSLRVRYDRTRGPERLVRLPPWVRRSGAAAVEPISKWEEVKSSSEALMPTEAASRAVRPGVRVFGSKCRMQSGASLSSKKLALLLEHCADLIGDDADRRIFEIACADQQKYIPAGRS